MWKIITYLLMFLSVVYCQEIEKSNIKTPLIKPLSNNTANLNATSINIKNSTSLSAKSTSTTETILQFNDKLESINTSALLRGFYVFLGLSVIVVMYLAVKSLSTRRNLSSRVHKYGIVANREDVEMTPLDNDDDEDDTVVFDLSNHPPS